jgi:hypothetical protein
MLLDSVSKSIKVVLGAIAAANNCPVTAFYVDHTDAGGTPGSSDTATNGVTAVTVVASPAADTQRQVKMITVYNADTAPVTVYTQFVNGGTTRIVNKSTLAVGDSLVYQNEIGFRILAPTGIFLSDVSDRAARLLGVISGAVTTDALKPGDLSIEALTKYLNVNSRWTDIAGTTYGYKQSDGLPRIEAKPYYTNIGEGKITGHTPWMKIGYNGALVAATEADVWSKTGAYAFPVTASTMRVVSSSAGDEDTGVIIKTGTSTGGTTASLIDTTGGVNFNGVVAVEVGDCILLDKANEGGRTPEWGYVTAVTSNTELAVAGGFSSGGTGSGRTYNIVDKVLAATPRTGAQCWKVDYLDANYNTYTELGVFDGNATVATVGTMWRINSFRVIATGTGNKPVGNLTLDNAGGIVYSYITLGFTRARNAMYTVPLGKTLMVTSWTAGYAYAQNSTHYCRIYTRANVEPNTGFNTGSLFYPFTEIVMSNNSLTREFEIPTKLPAKTDIKVSALADFAGVVTSALRGWLE